MATYYPSSSPQLEILSTSYDRDQKFTSSFSESPLLHGSNNMMMYSEIPPTVNTSVPEELQLNSSNNRMNIVDGEQNLQGLSLSLSTQMSTVVSTPPFQFQYSNPHASPSKDLRNNNNNGSDYFSYDMQQYSMNPMGIGFNSYQYEQAGISNTILKSRYLQAAKELLDEVVNVHDAVKEKNSNKGDEDSKVAMEANELASGSVSVSSHELTLTPTEKQDLQNKLDKLHSLLDEVDRRYKQYCHQMQILVSSIDMVAGRGSAKPYTCLALKTISRHFRCLRDAITGQIQATRKSLGEQDNNNGLGAIPRLRYVDQQLKQQRALQQFGMMRHAWRPQRGLPESAVTVLRAWLFEHFLHPYPKDSEKIMLARQTGLTRSQVANWFINARVRLWKPMVEEMYKEEFGDVEINPRSSPEHTPKTAQEKSWISETHDSKTNDNDHLKAPSSSTSGFHGFYTQNETIPSDLNPNGHQFMTSAYQMSELGNFSVENNTQQVSLALGLRGNGNGGAETSEYPYMEQVSQQHRFGNSHILNDFVA